MPPGFAVVTALVACSTTIAVRREASRLDSAFDRTVGHYAKPSGSQLFYDTPGSADKTLKLYEGHYHDLLHDVGKEHVLADITSWIDARVSTA